MVNSEEPVASQLATCAAHGAAYLECPGHLKLGISRSVRLGERPVHGMRHAPEGETTGWYIWSGDLSDAPDFFVPLHACHVAEWCPEVVDYLGLAPGWRFLLDGDYVDVWEDRSLLEGS